MSVGVFFPRIRQPRSKRVNFNEGIRHINAALSALDTAKKIAYLALDKKAENVILLQMNEVANFCDYFVICSGTSSRHVKAIADGIDLGLSELGIKLRHKQGLESISKSRFFSLSQRSDSNDEDQLAGHWVLLDMGDVVVHIFEGSSREFYALEHLWAEARPVDWSK